MEKIPLTQVVEKVENLLRKHTGEIEQIWTRDEKVGVNVSIKLFMKDGHNECAVGVSFTKEKIKDGQNFPWSDKQIEMELKVKGKGKKVNSKKEDEL